MSLDTSKLDRMLETLAKASRDRRNLRVGEFAEAVETIRTELKFMEAGLNRLDNAINNVRKGSEGSDIDQEPSVEAMTNFALLGREASTTKH